jgi:hypothetical protein
MVANVIMATRGIDFPRATESFGFARNEPASFKTDVRKAIFDGARMDKATYALLKGYKANLAQVTVN